MASKKLHIMEEEVNTTLPEDLVERILVMVPFPQIFKARVLSKLWLARLSPVSFHEDDEDKKRLALLFQTRLLQYSTKWQTFGPVFAGKKALIAYDRASQHWRTIPALSFLHENPLVMWDYSDIQILDMKGALVLITMDSKDLYVANVVTRSWKRLPRAPDPESKFYPKKLAVKSHTYKVIVVINLRRDSHWCLFGQIYDSQLGVWSSKTIDISGDLRIGSDRGDSGAESLDGVFYWVVYCHRDGMPWGFLAFNVKQEIFEVIEFPHTDLGQQLFQRDMPVSELVVCNGSLLMASYEFVGIGPRRLALRKMLKMDLVSQTLLKVTGSPRNAPISIWWSRKNATSDGKYIFIVDDNFSRVAAYDVQKDEWDYISTPYSNPLFESSWPIFEEYQGPHPFSFQPRLNPFVAL